MDPLFNSDMNAVMELYEKLYAFNPDVASYIVPNAFNRRVLLQMNLRSAFHFIKLRSAPNAHFAIRRIALKIAEEIRMRYPLFATVFQFRLPAKLGNLYPLSSSTDWYDLS